MSNVTPPSQTSSARVTAMTGAATATAPLFEGDDYDWTVTTTTRAIPPTDCDECWSPTDRLGVGVSPAPSAPRRLVDVTPDDVMPVELDEAEVRKEVPVSEADLQLVLETAHDARYPPGQGNTPQDNALTHDVMLTQAQRGVNNWCDEDNPHSWAGQTRFSVSKYSFCIMLGMLYRSRGVLPSPNEMKVSGRGRTGFVKSATLDFANWLASLRDSDFPKNPSRAMGLTQAAQEQRKRRILAEGQLYDQVRGMWKVASGQQRAADQTLRAASKERSALLLLDLKKAQEETKASQRATQVATEEALRLRAQLLSQGTVPVTDSSGPDPTPTLDVGAGIGARKTEAGKNQRRAGVKASREEAPDKEKNDKKKKAPKKKK